MRDWLYLAVCGAGRGAQDRFDELAARWRARTLWRVRVFTGVALAGLVAGALFERHYGALALGAAAGAVVALFMSFRDEVPAHIEYWRFGYTGERKTAKVLAPLRRRGCVPLHDLPDRRTEHHTKGNVDHVLVAPWGVYLLDSKMLGGSVTVDGDVVRVQRLDDESDDYLLDRLATAMRGKAVSLKKDIQAATGLALFVHAVVVLWSPFEAGAVESNAVTYVQGDQLADWLEQRRLETPNEQLMDSGKIERIVTAIDDARPHAERFWWRELQARTGLRRHRDDSGAETHIGPRPAVR